MADTISPYYTSIRELEEGRSVFKTTINNNMMRPINLGDIQDCYFLVYRNLTITHPEKACQYELLLKLNQNDYKTTVLQIETGNE